MNKCAFGCTSVMLCAYDNTVVVGCLLFSCMGKKVVCRDVHALFRISCEYHFFFWLHNFIPGVP